jgi:hypothetical protein
MSRSIHLRSPSMKSKPQAFAARRAARREGKVVVAVLSGGNIDPELCHKLAA